MRGDELSERMLNFAARIIKLAASLPKTTVGDHICIQLVKSGTSSGANYEEARAAESKTDFSHKLSVSLKELRETKFWLMIIEKTGLIPSKRMGNIIMESDELCKILGKSLITVRGYQCKMRNEK
ncbi:four helix bundle protein [Candidatus Sumerlaeota bacterium]|nr:four helix bundle protein [Candidatus Sumerlaeota bacterium]